MQLELISGCRAKDKESNYADHGVRKYDDEIGRFTSIDPLWEKYYSLTPYQYAGNNPVSFLDGNGKDYYLVGTPEECDKAIDDLNNEMSGANFSYGSDGKLNLDNNYIPKNAIETEFLSNMNDSQVDVNLFLETAAAVSMNGESTYLLPGAYGGADVNNSTGKIDAKMALNIDFSRRHNAVGGTSSGLNIVHEILEGFFGAKSNGAHSYTRDIQQSMHNRVMGLDPRQNDGVTYGEGRSRDRLVNYFQVSGPNGSTPLFNKNTGSILPLKIQPIRPSK